MTEMTKLQSDSLQLLGSNEEKMDCNEVTSLCNVENQGGSHLSLYNEATPELSIDEAIGMFLFRILACILLAISYYYEYLMRVSVLSSST